MFDFFSASCSTDLGNTDTCCERRHSPSNWHLACLKALGYCVEYILAHILQIISGTIYLISVDVVRFTDIRFSSAWISIKAWASYSDDIT